MTPLLKHVCATVAVAMMAAGPLNAFAQTTDQNQPPKPNPEQRVPPPRGPDDQLGQTPSEQLNQSHGVLHPPATGDENVIEPKTPGIAPMPSPPPPGTPGGNPDVQPK